MKYNPKLEFAIEESVEAGQVLMENINDQKKVTLI